jgi:tetratricopeptide (TPR) repeat protein
MDFLFDQPYIRYGVGFIVALVLYRLLARGLRGGRAAGGITGNVARDVRRFKGDGNYLAAGKLLEDAGKPQEAVNAYLEGREHYAAAATLEGMRQHEKAAELYLKAGDHKKAAQVMVSAGKPARAAALFLETGNSLEAARLYGVSGAWDKAGDLYARAGYPLRAAESYEKNGAFARAAEYFEKHFMENVSYGTTYATSTTSPDQKSALLAGRNYEKAGDLKAALQIYTRGSYFKEAATVSTRSGQFAQAGDLFLRAEEPAAAADAYERAGDRVKAANLRGEIGLKEGRVAEAAASFRDGQDYLRAAELFESINMHAEAAAAFEAGDSHAAAGSIYIRARMPERAAEAYERAGELETAAHLYEQAGLQARAIPLYEKAGLTFKSAEAAAQAGDRDRAIALLQRVDPSDEHHAAAAVMLGQLFVESGRSGLAVERLQKAIGGERVSKANLDLYYWLAAAHEKDSPLEAIALYKSIQAESLHFREVGARLAALEAAQAAAAAQPQVDRRRPAAAPLAPAPPPPPVAALPTPQPPPPPPVAAPPVVAVPRPAVSAPPASDQPRFVPREELGRGPLGTVFRAEDVTDGRSVALRVIPNALLVSEALASAVAADLRAASAVSHPNGVKVLALVDHEGQHGVVTEYVAGRNFAEVIRKGNRTTPHQAHSLGCVLAQYLAVVHGQGLVHGSIQPSNIMVSGAVVKVADLGLGRLAQAVPSDMDYRAPERGLDVAGDLYALAAVLYHLITGTHPRTLPQGAALPLPSSFAPGLTEAMDRLLVRALHPKVPLRLESADAFLAELKNMVRLV